MKLYNLYQEVIFEETQNKTNLLSEGISDSEVKAAIQGKYNVRIKYRDYDDGTPPSNRYIQIYVLGLTKAGNEAIRAFQINGWSKTTPRHGAWKIFRLDKIEGIEKTKMKWYNPVSDYETSIPAYNQTGDDSFTTIIMQVDQEGFKRQRSDISQRPEKQEPISNVPSQDKKPEVNKPEKPIVDKSVEPTQIQPEVEPEIGDNEEELEKDIYGNTQTS
jgi:hypothetical protein